MPDMHTSTNAIVSSVHRLVIAESERFLIENTNKVANKEPITVSLEEVFDRFIKCGMPNAYGAILLDAFYKSATVTLVLPHLLSSEKTLLVIGNPDQGITPIFWMVLLSHIVKELSQDDRDELENIFIRMVQQDADCVRMKGRKWHRC